MMPEFARPVLEALRQPLETGEAVVTRVNAHARYPARVQLMAAMNPCRCGYLADPSQACSKAPNCGIDYQSRLSGPLLDRIDIQLETPAVSIDDLSAPPAGEGTADAAARVVAARALQAERSRSFHPTGRPRLNAELDGDALDGTDLDDDAAAMLRKVADRLKLSARGWRRTLRVARTIADLAQSEPIRRAHVAEAAGFRRAPLIR